MGTDGKDSKQALRYPTLVACLSGKLERDAVNYADEEWRRQSNEAYLIAELFGFSTDTIDWVAEKIDAYDWKGNTDAKKRFVARVNHCALIEQRRDELWKEITALQEDREPYERGVLVRAYVDSIGYQVSLYENGVELGYSLRDFGGSPTADEQEQMVALLHMGIAHYMQALALALRAHFDDKKPLKTFDYKSVIWD